MGYNVQKTHEVSLILFMKGVFTMSEKKHHVTSLYERIPAVAELNKVPGFDPRKLLRRTVSRTGNEEVLKLDLRYKKLWFRLAHPHGRLKLNALRITEQLAIFEAGVYLDRSDSEPIGNFTAACTREEISNGHYVKAAQEAALDEALTNAGFGLQFSDICVGRNGERYGSEIPLADVQTVRNDNNVVEPAKIPTRADYRTVTPQTSSTEVKRVTESTSIPEKEERTVTILEADKTLTSEARSDNSGEMDQLPTELMEAVTAESTVKSLKTDTSLPENRAALEPMAQETPQSQVSYTADMPVAEIIKRMTFEEAQNVTVDEGTCSGWTMAEVAERRPPSLKWYVYGYKKNNNILRAAAQIMWDSLNGQKAG